MSTDSWQWLVDLGVSQWEGHGARQTRWDVITTCNLEKIYRAVQSQDEKPPRDPSPHRNQAPLLLKREALRTNSAWLASPRGVSLETISNQLPPWSLVRSPRSGTAARQSSTVWNLAQPATQLSWDPPLKKRSSTYITLQIRLVSACLSFSQLMWPYLLPVHCISSIHSKEGSFLELDTSEKEQWFSLIYKPLLAGIEKASAEIFVSLFYSLNDSQFHEKIWLEPWADCPVWSLCHIMPSHQVVKETL